ncbi:major facilitator superfamily transporter [Colletotrichum acutatum]|uniref:Major facilitator superfamily transporter n=1 Tax=Glomerella acutata TaxID=27357 RepID=A0AAD8UIH7_GLOAC|nr:major facilitator superfamily transporter [Colletotrichum acutatum]KAK1723843.1 major facilitator superfamily transporter [Colletotrichum acutatum]
MSKADIVEAPHVVEDVADGKQRTNYDKVDNEVAKYAGETIVEIDPETNKRLKRMIDKRVLSVMVFTYFMQSLDKGTMSFASIMGIIPDTGLVGQQYSWLTTIIYLVILCVEYPENYIIQKIPIAKWLSFNIIMWGVTLSLHAACHNFVGLVIVRGFLGGFEAVCQPTFVLLTSMWYKREEQASTAIYWYMMNGLQQIIGGLLAFGFSFIPSSSPIRSWQALFMTYGIITVFWGAFVMWWMPDSPMKAHCFSEEDKKLMVERVRSNRTGLQNRKWRKEQVFAAFKDPQVYGFAIIQLLTTLPSGGLGAFANIIIKSFGFSTWETQLLQSVTGILQIITMLTASWIDRRFKQTILAMMAAVVPTIAGTVVLLTVPFEHSKKVGLLLAYYIMISFWACSGLALSLVTRNVAGQTKKGVVITSNFIFWAVGNSIGPQVFRAKDAPRYFLALAIILGCFVLLEVVLFALRTYYVWQNKLRDGKIARGEAVADTSHSHAFEDMTDKASLRFYGFFSVRIANCVVGGCQLQIQLLRV